MRTREFSLRKAESAVAMESPLDAGLSSILIFANHPGKQVSQGIQHPSGFKITEYIILLYHNTCIYIYIYIGCSRSVIASRAPLHPPQHAESALAIPAGTGLSYSDQTLDRSPDLLKNLGTSRVLCLCLRSVLLSLESVFSRHFS